MGDFIGIVRATVIFDELVKKRKKKTKKKGTKTKRKKQKKNKKKKKLFLFTWPMPARPCASRILVVPILCI